MVDPDSYEPRMKQKLTAWEVMTVSPATPEYLMWFEVPITFSHSDLSDFFPHAGVVPSHCLPHLQGC
jgi:hypothetical protein